ncbi:tumor necrosis factor b (TNF superfamily, member 2) isoform X2 [Brachyhypopomus gauderio]|uniref:tumor necrosis factor b (TNF superfamily, member 2) isoform X2 n=1 Tax=Brachyhypopomus gauderio TaxID=698409 RepID=UPI004041EA5D
MTAADLESGMGDVYQATVKSLRPPSGSGKWKTVGTVILLVSCVTAAVFLTWHFTTRDQQEAHTDMHSHTGADHQKMLRHIGKDKMAAIHLHVSDQDNKGMSLQWVSDVDQSFSKGGLKLKDNAIVIPSDGIYYVYTQASFTLQCQSSGEDADVTLNHAVSWSSPASPSAPGNQKYLLDGVKSVCQSSMQGQKNDESLHDVIYLGAIFRLHKGDKLSTETNHGDKIDDQGSKTFFGVFKL